MSVALIIIYKMFFFFIFLTSSSVEASLLSFLCLLDYFLHLFCVLYALSCAHFSFCILFYVVGSKKKQSLRQHSK